MPRFLLDKREVIKGGAFKDPLYEAYWHTVHLGCDYRAKYVPLYAHIDVSVFGLYWGKQGGNWLEMRGVDGYKLRLAHLKEYTVKQGFYKEGTQLAITGNTGEKTTGAHLHCEVINPQSIHIDPEIYFNNLLKKPMPDYAKQLEGQTIICGEEASNEKGKWFWVIGGKRRWIPDRMTGWAFGLLSADVIFVKDEVLKSIPVGEQLKYWEGQYYRFVEDIKSNKEQLK